MIHRFPTDEHQEAASIFRWPSGLQGRFDATAVSLEIDNALVRHALPRELVTNRDRVGKMHPLLLLVGVQHDVHSVAFGDRLHFPALKPYQEACVVIPGLRRRDHAHDHDAIDFTYFGRLYLDHSLPTYCGRWPWGWNKCLAKFRTSENVLTVERRGKGVLLKLATFAEPSDESVWTSLEWNRVVQWLDQPTIIGRKVVHRPRRLQFDWSAGSVKAANATVSLGSNLMSGIVPRSVASDGEGRSRCHAFHFDVPWFLHPSMAHDAGGRAAA